MKLSFKTLTRMFGKRRVLRKLLAYLLKLASLFWPQLYAAIKRAVAEAESHDDWKAEQKFKYVWDVVREKFDDWEDYRWVINFIIETLVGSISERYKVLLTKHTEPDSGANSG